MTHAHIARRAGGPVLQWFVIVALFLLGAVVVDGTMRAHVPELQYASADVALPPPLLASAVRTGIPCDALGSGDECFGAVAGVCNNAWYCVPTRGCSGADFDCPGQCAYDIDYCPPTPPSTTLPVPFECADGKDNDLDGKCDHGGCASLPPDADCVSASTTPEASGKTTWWVNPIAVTVTGNPPGGVGEWRLDCAGGITVYDCSNVTGSVRIGDVWSIPPYTSAITGELGGAIAPGKGNFPGAYLYSIMPNYFGGSYDVVVTGHTENQRGFFIEDIGSTVRRKCPDCYDLINPNTGQPTDVKTLQIRWNLDYRPTAAADDAACTSFSAPDAVRSGETFGVRAVMENTGSAEWLGEGSGPNPVRLGAPDGSWNLPNPPPGPGLPNSRVFLPVASVPPAPGPGNSVTFDFSATAPVNPGPDPVVKTFTVRMIREGAAPFGESCTKQVTVRPAGEPPECIFTVVPYRIVVPPSPGAAELAWQCRSASICAIDQGVGGVSEQAGQRVVALDRTTTYTLTCLGTDNVTRKSYVATARVFELVGGVLMEIPPQ